ncbi:ABC transporter permease [Microbacterium allomyrinae]|uniref:ABC transporter permease n=1 Tax=Microbacterium allomyrinae TaxID=2830666 RepID=A0A9X1LWP7_9MICO|nr:ABC transporter permease [Microbacterium allomyrinae]MCC2033257.1 ABC transporter permease [Microbacterium allomyrinae]
MKNLKWLASLKRIGRALLVIVLATFLVRMLMSLAPGSIAEGMLGENATPEAIAKFNEKWGLDAPPWQQYLTWLRGAVVGDLGESPLTGQSVMEAILERLPVTLELAFLGLGIALAVAIPFALICATWPGRGIDRALSSLSSVFLAVPAFIAGPVLIYVLAVQLRLFPVLGWNPLSEGLAANLQTAFIPALSIAFVEIAAFHRLLRADLISTLSEDYIAAARAKGMGGVYVMLRHALRPSSFSLVTVLGITLGALAGGTVVVETLFGLPGLGQLIVQSIMTRDVTMVMGAVTFAAVMYVGINTMVDVSYSFLDPRVRRRAAA